MATTLVSNIAVFPDQTGHGNQSHLVYATVQQRWWLLYTDSKTATVVKSLVSNSMDPAGVWSAGTDSPAFPSSRAMSANDRRNLAVAFVLNSINSNDAAHVSVGIGPTGTNVHGYIEHVRATFTGGSSITWDGGGWAELDASSSSIWASVKGNALGVGTGGVIHEAGNSMSIVNGGGNSYARLSTNADTTSTWTTGFGASAQIEAVANIVNSWAFAPLAGGAMLCVYENGGAADPNSTGLDYVKYSSGTTWPTGAAAATGNGTTSQDLNDWCLCGVDATHVFCVRRSGSDTFDMRMYSGSWSSKAAPPTQSHLAGSGIFLATDNADSVWMVIIDSTGNAIKWNKYSISKDSWGTWSTLATSVAAIGYVSGCPIVSNNQVAVIYTVVNGSNYDIVLSSLSAAAQTSPAALLSYL